MEFLNLQEIRLDESEDVVKCLMSYNGSHSLPLKPGIIKGILGSQSLDVESLQMKIRIL